MRTEAAWVLLASPAPLVEATLTGRDVTEVLHEYAYERIEDPANISDGDGLVPTSGPLADERHYPFFAGRLESRGWTVLYIEGEIRIEADGQFGLAIDQESFPGQPAFAANSGRGTVRPGMPAAEHEGVAMYQSGDPLKVHLRGNATVLEFHGVHPICPAECPRAALKETTRVSFIEAGSSTFSVLSGQMNVDAIATPSFIAWGATSLNVLVNGTARLPLASLGDCPAECRSEPDGTIRVAGDFTIADVAHEGNVMRASLAGRIDRLTLDEMDLPTPEWLLPAAATAGGLAFVAIGAFLVSKQLLANPLRHPRRERIYELLRDEPGLSFRQMQRRLGLANGNLHYHVFVMEQAGIIVSQSMGARKAFTIDGHAQDLARQSALRNRHLRRLHETLLKAPELREGSYRALARRLGWPESTTRYRMGQLRSVGLLPS